MEKTIPNCLGPQLTQSQPNWTVPKGAWDTHFHVLGPQTQFPYAQARKYTPPDAPLEVCFEMHNALGIERGFVVHANTYGFDNSVDLDAVARSGGRYLAVVRLDNSATSDGCRALHHAGARGVRFAFNPKHGGILNLDVFNHVLRCIDGLGWFIELHFDGAALPDLRPWIESIPAPVVIDHFGRVDPALGLTRNRFVRLPRWPAGIMSGSRSRARIGSRREAIRIMTSCRLRVNWFISPRTACFGVATGHIPDISTRSECQTSANC